LTQVHRLASNREQIYLAIDLANVRQILRGSALYNSDNDEHMAHPTWGSDLSGPDGWAYLTSNKDRNIPGALQSTPGSCASYDTNSRQFTNQLAYFKVGQVTQYLPDIKNAWCPKDFDTRRNGPLRRPWLARPVKVTSYSWNGTVGGYVGLAGDYYHPYKVSDFLPTDYQMLEQNENDGFYFNDAAFNPESLGETFSYRHSGVENWWSRITINRSAPGGGIVGTFGGSGQFVKWPKLSDLVNKRIPYPNELLNGPSYRR
jgi:hypothetical protein